MEWLHVKSGNYYTILDFALREADLQPQVVYRRSDGTGPSFIRPCAEFFDGRFRSDDRATDRKAGDDLGQR